MVSLLSSFKGCKTISQVQYKDFFNESKNAQVLRRILRVLDTFEVVLVKKMDGYSTGQQSLLVNTEISCAITS